MPKLIKNSPEAKAFGQKMKALRDAKKVPIESVSPIVAEMRDIIKRYFPTNALKIVDRGNTLVVEIIIKEGDMRSFVVSRQMVLAETERWCQRIKANIEGKPLNTAIGIGLMTGRQSNLPSNIGADEEFFFREE